MTDNLNPNLAVYTQRLESGRWLAATGVAPYFCFEGDSREEVLNTATRALRFFIASVEAISAEKKREREQSIPNFDPNCKVSAKELVAA